MAQNGKVRGVFIRLVLLNSFNILWNNSVFNIDLTCENR